MGNIIQSPMKGNINSESVKTPDNKSEKPTQVEKKMPAMGEKPVKGIFNGDRI